MARGADPRWVGWDVRDSRRRRHAIGRWVTALLPTARGAPTLTSAMRSLHDPWTIGDLEIPNRVMLAPLAGIGNWFVRLQAKRFGAGLAVSR